LAAQAAPHPGLDIPPPLSLRRGSSPGGCRAAWNVGRCRDGGNAPGSSPQIRSRMEDFPEFSSPTTMIRGSLRVGCRPGNGARLEAMLAGGWYNSPLKIFDPWQNDGQAPKTNFEGGGKISRSDETENYAKSMRYYAIVCE